MMHYNKVSKDGEACKLFGYIITNSEALPKDRQERFRAFYCGLCRTLRSKYGLTGSATLSFDMTFLAMLLNALYEPGERTDSERCLTHPIRRHGYVDTPVMGYAADMNVALAYHKCRDNWLDDKNPVSAAQAKLLEGAYGRVKASWPGKCDAIEAWLDEIHTIESNDVGQIDPPLNSTGRMLGELFAWRADDLWADALRGVGDGLGRFIYFMDAYEDLPSDVRRKRYNPLKAYRERPDYEEFCRSAMMMMAGDAAREYAILPIVQDADILSNIIYSGIWSKYAAIQKRRKDDQKEREDARPL